MAVSTGCESTSSRAAAKPAAATLGKQPTPAVDVSCVQAWRDAEKLSGGDGARTTVVGSGESMQPIYGEKTVLVINKIAYEELLAGMTVAYVNALGRHVVHQLLAKDAQGWRVQGINNTTEDTDRVTRQNLIGVVYASFATDEGM